MTFVGIDPAGMARMGALIDHRAGQIEWAASRVMDPLTRVGRASTADRVGTTLTATARVLQTSADDFRWRIDAVRAESPWTSRLRPANLLWASPAVLATAVPVGAGPPTEAVPMPLITVVSLMEKTPVEVAAYFAGESFGSISLLAAAHPAAIGAMDGAPLWARYAANDLLIAGRIAALNREAATVRKALASDEMMRFVRREVESQLEDVNREIAELALWLAEDRQILLFSAAGDGRVVEVFGDLESAGHIGVVVPGITNDRANFSDGAGGFRANARNIHDRAVELGIGDVATIAWLGYDTPDGADAVLQTAAKAGHDELVDFVAGLDQLSGNRHITVIGHSYGSLVTGLAAAEGLAANEVVFVGSPGTGLDHADDAKLEPGGVVWAGLADGDPIGAGVDVKEYLTPFQRLEQAARRVFDVLDGEDDRRDLHHGINPAHHDFGAIEIHTDGSSGHSEYFMSDTVTLDNLLYIIAAMDGNVSIEIPEVIDMAPGPFGEPTPSLPTITA